MSISRQRLSIKHNAEPHRQAGARDPLGVCLRQHGAVLPIVAIAIALGFSLPAGAQTAALVKDIFPEGTNAGSSPENFTRVGDQVFFSANDGAAGHELYVTEGSATDPTGARLVKDICPGNCSANPRSFTSFNGRVYFIAFDGETTHLYASDGQAGGTIEFFDNVSGNSDQFAVIGDRFFFASYEPGQGNQLWVTNGSQSDARKLTNLAGAGVSGLTPAGPKLYFFVTVSNLVQLWQTDGMTAAPVRDIGEGAFFRYSAAVGNLIFFVAGSNDELWVSDGAQDHTMNITPANLTGSIGPPVAFQGRAFFAATVDNDRELWYVDTGDFPALAPARFKDINEYPTGSDYTFPSNPESLTVAGDKLYFAAGVGETTQPRKDLYFTDGTPDMVERAFRRHSVYGTSPIELAPFDSDPPDPLLEDLVFVSSYPTPYLYRTDGETVEFLRDFPSGGRPRELVSFGDAIYFQAAKLVFNQGGQVTYDLEPWFSDGDVAKEFENINYSPNSSSPGNLFGFQGKLFFSAAGNGVGRELWVSGGDESNTIQLQEICPSGCSSNPSDFVSFDDKLIFSAYDGDTANPQKIWVLNGVTPGASVNEIDAATPIVIPQDGPYGATPPTALTVAGNGVFFVANQDQIWTTNGVTAEPVKDLSGDPGGPWPHTLVPVGNRIFFLRQVEYSTELWTSNGTPDGTYQLPAGTSPRELVAMNGLLYFVSNDEIWSSDGDVENTVPLVNVAGNYTGSPEHLAVFQGNLFFAASDGVSGRELWVSGGSEADTYRFADINPGPDWSHPQNLTVAGGRLFFSADNGINGRELWATDGEAVYQVVDVNGFGSSDPEHLTPVGYGLFFEAFESATGRELWYTTGFSDHAVLVDNIARGTNWPYVDNLTPLGNTLFFSADGPLPSDTSKTTGDELWRVDMTASHLPDFNDVDSDGIPNESDLCPYDSGNSCPAAADGDDDGIPDVYDACPADPFNDADGDGICGDVDLCPADSTNTCPEAADPDGDGIPNGTDPDDDGDGIEDGGDACSLDPMNTCLFDPDDDGIPNPQDACPIDPNNECADDANGNGIPNTLDNDADGDGTANSLDPCPFDAVDLCQFLDSDGDGVANTLDRCPSDPADECHNPVGAGAVRTVAGGGPVDGSTARHYPLASATGVTVDKSGNLYIATATHQILFVNAATGATVRVAGTGRQGFSGDGGPAREAEINSPYSPVVDRFGNLLYADLGAYRVRMISPGADGVVNGGDDEIITTVAGNGSSTFSGDGGPATSAGGRVQTITLDASGTLFIASSASNRIRRVEPGADAMYSGAADEIITTVAGTGVPGTGGDGNPAAATDIAAPVRLRFDASGNLFFIDGLNQLVRWISPGADSVITGVADELIGTVAPVGAAPFASPQGLAFDRGGGLLVAESGTNQIRRVDPGADGIFNAGTDESVTTVLAGLGEPQDLANDLVGRAYVAEFHSHTVRRIGSGADGRIDGGPDDIVSVVAGSGSPGFFGDGGFPNNAALSLPGASVIAPDGSIYIAETFGHRIRRLAPGPDGVVNGGTGERIDTVAGNGTPGSDGDGDAATGARLNGPYGVALDPAGNLLIVDRSNGRIRRVSAGADNIVAGDSDETITTVVTGLANPFGIALDSSGSLLITVESAHSVIRVTPGADGIIDGSADETVSAIAGTGVCGPSGDGGPADAAQLCSPTGLALDATGNLFVNDTGNRRIRRVEAGADGIVNGGVGETISTVVGNGVSAFGGDGGPATQASIRNVRGITFDIAGNLYLADTSDHRVRLVIPGADGEITGDVDEVISTVAGTGVPGYSGDGGPATNARFYFTEDIDVDPVGNLYITDRTNNRLRLVEALDRDGDGQTDVTDPCPDDPADACLNQPPTANDVNVSTDEDAPIAFQVLATDPDGGGSLTFTLESPPSPPVAGASLSGVATVVDGQTASITPTYSPGSDFSGVITIVYRVTDGTFDDIATVTITVNPVNDAPAFPSNPPSDAPEGTVFTNAYPATDADGDILVYSAQGLPAGATFDPTTATVVWPVPYSIASNETPVQEVSFVITASDGQTETQHLASLLISNVSTGTPPGNNVIVQPIDPNTGTAPVILTFDSVEETGQTTVITTAVENVPAGTPAPGGFRISENTYFDVETTATFSGNVQVCFSYAGLNVDESNLGLLHLVENGHAFTNPGLGTCSEPDGCWELISSPDLEPPGFPNPNPDTENQLICGVTNSFSLFAIAEPVTLDGLLDPVQLGSPFTATLSIPGAANIDHALFDWGDGGPPSTIPANGEAVVSADHVYQAAGVYVISVTLAEGTTGGSVPVGSAEFRYAVIYDPDGGFVTGGGWFLSPEGAYTTDPLLTGKATFGFVSKYKKGANVPTGNTEFQFKAGDLDFKSTEYDWLVIAGARAQFKGSGVISGAGDYGFLLTAIDGQVNGGSGVDKFRIKIWDKVTETIIYDNQPDEDDTTDSSTEVGGGSITVHNGK